MEGPKRGWNRGCGYDIGEMGTCYGEYGNDTGKMGTCYGWVAWNIQGGGTKIQGGYGKLTEGYGEITWGYGEYVGKMFCRASAICKRIGDFFT